MTDPNTFTAEHRSWQWEVMLKFEDGSLPASDWNEATLSVVADWYAKNLPRDQAIARYDASYKRNHHRLTHRLGAAAVQTEAIDALDKVWESLLTKRLDALNK